MGRIITALLLGLALGCAAWTAEPGRPAGTDKALLVFTARWQAMRLDDRDASRSQPMDACGACLELCRDMGDGYAGCAERCRESCGLGASSAWAVAVE